MIIEDALIEDGFSLKRKNIFYKDGTIYKVICEIQKSRYLDGHIINFGFLNIDEKNVRMENSELGISLNQFFFHFYKHLEFDVFNDKKKNFKEIYRIFRFEFLNEINNCLKEELRIEKFDNDPFLSIWTPRKPASQY